MAEVPNNGNKAPSTTLSLMVTWDQLSGQVNVTGTLVNKVVCYGMLDLAREVIKEFFDKQQSTIALVPPGFTVGPPKVVT